MPAVVAVAQQKLAQRFRQVYSAYSQQRDLITIGAYQKGSDPRVDEAIALWPALSAFLQQEVSQAIDLDTAVHALARVLASDDARPAAGAMA
jgi:flagellum-specific ATP synthase